MTDNSKTYDRETFVHGDKEVFKTGREALKTKTLRSGKQTQKKMIEVCPVSMKDKTTTMYNKWVDERELFCIIDNNQYNDES